MGAVRQLPQNRSLAFVLNERVYLIHCSKFCSQPERPTGLDISVFTTIGQLNVIRWIIVFAVI